MTEHKEKNDNIIAYKENKKAAEKALEEYESQSGVEKALLGNSVESSMRKKYSSMQIDLMKRNRQIEQEIKDLQDFIDVENYGSKESEDTQFASGGGKDGGKSVSDLTSGGSKATNVTINLRNLIEHLNLSSATLPEGVDNITNLLIEGLLRALNSTTKIATN